MEKKTNISVTSFLQNLQIWRTQEIFILKSSLNLMTCLEMNRCTFLRLVRYYVIRLPSCSHVPAVECHPSGSGTQGVTDFAQRVTRLVTFQGIPIDSETQTLRWAIPNQWRIQDFPRGGANSQNCYYFSHFCRKLHENERIWTPRGGRASLAPPLGSANANGKFKIG